MIKPAPPEVVTPAAGPHHHQPLSQLLTDLLAESSTHRPLTLNDILFRSEGRGIYLLMILLVLPFLQPLPLFGLSTPLGMIIMILAIRHGIGLPPRIPRRFGDRPLPENFKLMALNGSASLLRRLERWVKPRRDRWLSSAPSRLVHSGLVAILAFLLALPLPPFVVFSNVVPGFVLVIICLSMMEEDGVLIWLAYLGIIGNIIYFGAVVASTNLIIRNWNEWFDWVKHLFA